MVKINFSLEQVHPLSMNLKVSPNLSDNYYKKYFELNYAGDNRHEKFKSYQTTAVLINHGNAGNTNTLHG